MQLGKFLRHKCIIFFYFVTKTGIFCYFCYRLMCLNLICYVLHKPLLFPLFTHSSGFGLVPFELASFICHPSQHLLTIQLGPRRCSIVGKTGLRRKGYISTSSLNINLSLSSQSSLTS